MRVLHCSDVHVTADYSAHRLWDLGWRRWVALFELTVGGRARKYKQAQRTLAQIARDGEALGVDHFIVSGDLTAYAMESEFAGAREALAPWAGDKAKCTIIPGNHDTYTPEVRRERLFERYFGHLLESDLPEYAREGPFPFVRLLGDDAAVVGLLSARVPPVPGLSFGVIGRRQLDGLRAMVADARMKHRAVLVTVHHAPLARSGRKDKFHHGLVDGSALFDIVHGPRFAVLHGHIHQRYHHEASNGRPHTFGAGSSTEAGHEGYWLIELAGGKVLGGEMRTPGG